MKKVAFIGYGDIAERTSVALDSMEYTELYGLCRQPAYKANPAEVQLVAGNASNGEDIAKLITPDIEVIVLTLTPDRDSQEPYFDGYVVPCRLLQHHLKSQGHHPQIIYVSSTGVYSERDGEWIDETTAANPNDANGRALLQAEQIIQSSSDRSCILRCSGIYGPNRSRLAELIISGKAVITPAWTNRIHADDVAGFIAYLVQHPEQQQPLFLVSDDEPLLQEHAYARLANRLGMAIDSLPRSHEIGRRGSKRIGNRLLRASGYQLLHPTYQPK